MDGNEQSERLEYGNMDMKADQEPGSRQVGSCTNELEDIQDNAVS